MVYGITRQELIKHTNVRLTPSYLVELNKSPYPPYIPRGNYLLNYGVSGGICLTD